MAGLKRSNGRGRWSLVDTYDFISTFVSRSSTQWTGVRRDPAYSRRLQSLPAKTTVRNGRRTYHTFCLSSTNARRVLSRPSVRCHQLRRFHDYFVTHLPSSSLHPDSRSSTGPHHKLPRDASTPHPSGRRGPSPAAAPPMVGASRELTVVRIPLRSAKHHFGASVSRGTRPYNEDTHQAGTIEIPAFAKRAPVSLSRSKPKVQGKETEGEATSADSASGDPQVFYFGVFDGHGGSECSEFLKEELHSYIENSALEFELGSSLRKKKSPERDVGGPSAEKPGTPDSELSSKGKESLSSIDVKGPEEVKESLNVPEAKIKDGSIRQPPASPAVEGESPIPQPVNKPKSLELQSSLVNAWKDTVGGYFRRFKPDHFTLAPDRRSSSSSPAPTDKQTAKQSPTTIETVLMYAFLRADLDFVSAQAAKPDANSTGPDLPLNNDEILGRPSQAPMKKIGGDTRFKGGSTASIAMISTPTPTPFWHPASPSTLMVAHVGDTRILLCETATGLAVPITTNHHPSSPIEGTRLRRYAATFVTDSFGEERMSGLANTRAFGDMRSKRIGVSAEPELVRVPLGPAQYSFMVLMSDGVSGTLTDQEVVDVVKEARTPDGGARDVVGFATEVSKEGDNATCLVVRLGGWERRGEGGTGSLGTKEVRDFRRQEATDPRTRRT